MVKPETVKGLVPLLLILVLILVGCGETSRDEAEGTTLDRDPEETPFSELLGELPVPEAYTANVAYYEDDTKEFEQRIAMQNGNIRSEVLEGMDGEQTVTIYNRDENVMYVYEPEENTAMQWDLDEGDMGDMVPEPEDMDPVGWLDYYDDESFTYVGEEAVDGKDCYVFSLEDEEGETGKFWVWKEYAMVLKMAGPAAVGGGEEIIEYTEVTVGEVDPGEFRLPDGVEIETFDF